MAAWVFGENVLFVCFLHWSYNLDSNAACAPVVLCGENVIFVVILWGFHDLDCKDFVWLQGCVERISYLHCFCDGFMTLIKMLLVCL